MKKKRKSALNLIVPGSILISCAEFIYDQIIISSDHPIYVISVLLTKHGKLPTAGAHSYDAPNYVKCLVMNNQNIGQIWVDELDIKKGNFVLV